MTLDEVLEKLGQTRAVEISNCGKSAGWHWYQVGSRRKVPEMQTLIAWADYLQLSDADLGELVRDAHRVRISVMEMLSKVDKRRLKTRSALRRDLAKEIADELSKDVKSQEKDKKKELEKKRKAAAAKQKFLEEQAKEQARLRRLEEYRMKLNKIRNTNDSF